MSCDQCTAAGLGTSCNRGDPCFICISKKIHCTYNSSAKPVVPKRQPTAAEKAAGAESRAGSPANQESNYNNTDEEEAKQAVLRKEVAAMTESSKLNENKKKKRKSRKATRTTLKRTRKFKHK